MKNVLFLYFCLLFSSCHTILNIQSKNYNNQELTPRIINFSGFEWLVRDSDGEIQGPGNNLYSSSKKNVWVDSKGRLHLKITYANGKWYCSGVRLNKSLGYGTYTFHVDSDISRLNKNAVAGMFTYLTDHEEIDIEFSKWSDENASNSQYVVQPTDVSGNVYRFDIMPKLKSTVHSFEWREDGVFFKSIGFKNNTELPLGEWAYKGEYTPKEDAEVLELNLWLYKGQAPNNHKEVEIIISRVSFAP